MEFKQIGLWILFLCELNYVFTLNDTDKNNGTMCTNNKCIMKCCPFGKFMNTKRVVKKNKTKLKSFCDDHKEHRDISKLDADFNAVFLQKPNLTEFEVKSGIFMADKTFRANTVNVATDLSVNLYLSKDAEVLLEMPNFYDRWTRIPSANYCLDLINMDREGNTITLGPAILVPYKEVPETKSRTNTLLKTIGMCITCFFLLLVLVVYGLLPELRTLGGQILMAYVACLLGAFLMLIVMRVKQHEKGMCVGLTLLTYLFFLSSFCWMTVMSFDLWWTFRGYAKARPIHQRGERYKFLIYCAYTWGTSLGMTIALAVVNSIDMTHIPWFITPKIPGNSCFIKDEEKLLYLYLPMLILILSNWMFYIMTAFNVWRLSRGTSMLDSQSAGSPHAHRKQLRRFFVYLKLSIVMGLNWLLEVLSYMKPDSVVWDFSDYYNILIGVSIFLIFVCKGKILKKLKKVFSRWKKSTWSPDQEQSTRSTTVSGTTDSSVSQETSQVCVSPGGPGYVMKNLH